MKHVVHGPGEIVGELKRVLREGRVVRNQTGRLVPTSEEREVIKEILARATPAAIAQAEQELSREGYTFEDSRPASDIHLELLYESLGRPPFDLPTDHPIFEFELDHQIILEALDELLVAALRLREGGDRFTDPTGPAPNEKGTELAKEIEQYVDILLAAENHNVRQENTLFPMLERHGIEQLPAIMRQEHTEMRDIKERIQQVVETLSTRFDLGTEIEPLALGLFEIFASHSNKERKILCPAALELFGDEDWRVVKDECDEIGYFTRNLPQNWQLSSK